MAFQYEVEQQVKHGQNTCGKESEMKEKCENTKEGTMEHSAVETDVAKKSSLKMYTSVLSSPAMLLLLLSHFLLHLGIFSTFSFSSDRAVQAGLTLSQSSLLLSIMGASNCLGRILFGLLLDRLRALTVHLTTLVVLTNALTVLTGHLPTGLLGHALHSAVFGLTFGAYVTSIVPVLKTLSCEVTAPLGATLATLALASLAGPLGVGAGYDLGGTYTSSFLVVGGLGVLGALLLPSLLLLARRRGGYAVQ